MKKKFLYVGLIVFAITLGIGSSLYFTENTKQENNTLNHVYKSLDSIYEDSQLIVKAKVPNYFIENEVVAGDGITFTEKIYDIEIEKVYDNKTNINIKNKDIIKLTQSSNLKIVREGDLSTYPVSNIEKLEEGTYLLFLKTYYDEAKGEVVYYPAPENIYKIDKNNKFKNIGGNYLPELDEIKLEEKAKENK